MPDEEPKGTGPPVDDLERQIKQREERMAEIQAQLERADAVQKMERKRKARDAGKFAAVAVAVILVVAGGVYAYHLLPPGPRYGHDHYAFRMYNDTQEIRFDDPAFDFSHTQNVRGHLHLSGGESTSFQYIIHTEGELGITLGYFFDTIDVHIKSGKITLDRTVHQGQTLSDNSTHAWQLWVDACKDGPGPWIKESQIRGFKPTLFDRMVITFAPRDANETSLQREFDAVPSVDEMSQSLHQKCGEDTSA